MAYLQGFLAPVPEGNKDAYKKMASDVVPLFTDYGAQRIVECWGVEVPRGENTDMYRAVNAEDGDGIIFSWIDYDSEEAFKKGHDSMMQDERMKDAPENPPFDGMRMIYAGFDQLGESGAAGGAGYVQGYVAPVPAAKKAAYADMCETMRQVAIDAGALHAVDSWAENIEDGKVTDFKQAVQAEDGEAVAFGYVEWPSQEAFQQGMAKMQADKRMPGPGSDMPLDGKRLIFGGFEVLMDTNEDKGNG